ncbi:unnamed protein product [Pseudo-nitzschia multistriata]|uniref:Uncharacterized protein n=1 Tax=Pseudo-nitzschia multistriata TaxID=183589 RepID=A0A448ZLN3_9STRA|nr:unnamed protein product [Pseudo-nitzschia multistriata]
MKSPSSKQLLLVVLIFAATNVRGFQKQKGSGRKANSNYLDSLTPKSTEIPPPTMQGTAPEEDTTTEIPDEHYSKAHFGAGWTGYKHPLYGGYLDHLNDNTKNSGDQKAAIDAKPIPPAASSDAAGTNSAILQAGKKADYGDDIRWGAQVYLDNL